MTPCTCIGTCAPIGYIVVGQVLLGRSTPVIYGDELHDTTESAECEMSEIAVGLGIEGRGLSLLVHVGDLPAALVITADGRMWGVRVRPVHLLDLPVLLSAS